MNLVFDKERLVLPISTDLQDVINMVIDRSQKLTPSTHAVTINFRDSSYSTESGGFHPTEIRITRLNDQWIFDYITDFSYCGLMPELEKEIDFDFGH
ncbi:DUF2787 family protein, partial [Vibrio splendidus]